MGPLLCYILGREEEAMKPPGLDKTDQKPTSPPFHSSMVMRVLPFSLRRTHRSRAYVSYVTCSKGTRSVAPSIHATRDELRPTAARRAAMACFGLRFAHMACWRLCQMQVARFSPAAFGAPYLGRKRDTPRSETAYELERSAYAPVHEEPACGDGLFVCVAIGLVQ